MESKKAKKKKGKKRLKIKRLGKIIGQEYKINVCYY